MPVDPNMTAVITAMEQTPRWYEQASAAVRAQSNTLAAALPTSKSSISVRVEDISIPSTNENLEARVYQPNEGAPLPTATFFHGGGFVAGNFNSYDTKARRLITSAGKSPSRSNTGLHNRLPFQPP